MPAETTQQDQYGSGSDPRARRDEHDEYHPKSSRENVCVFPPPGWSGLGRSLRCSVRESGWRHPAPAAGRRRAAKPVGSRVRPGKGGWSLARAWLRTP